MRKLRLGLDIGTNSIGWAILDLGEGVSPVSIEDSGVRIFSDGRNPKDKQSLAVQRRLPRQQRKTRDRYLTRRRRFMSQLIQYGLMPEDEAARKDLECVDPWGLRVNGLKEQIPLHHLGRALFHLQQRRGFKSNRKTDSGGDNDSGKIKDAATKLETAMKETGAKTIGQFLAQPRINDKKAAHTNPVRARLHGAGSKAYYDFYPTRELIEQEFIALWDAQKDYHKTALTDEAKTTLLATLLFQLDLKKQKVGKCSLNPNDERAPRALPSFQSLRIYQEINHLLIRLPGEKASPLTLTQRDKLVAKAFATKKLTFDSCRKILKLPEAARFSIESEKRKHIDGDVTAATLAAGKRWGSGWRELSKEDQERIVLQLLEVEKESDLITWLQNEYQLSEEIAQSVADAPLPSGHGMLGKIATQKVLLELKKGVMTYDQAVQAAGYPSHSQLDHDGEIFDRKLPYYGKVLERHVAFGSGEPDDPDEVRYGKIANPTVHMVLNQIRKLINALIKRHGPLAEIVVELARDLPLSAKGKSELESIQRDNQKANEGRREKLAKLGQQDNYENRLRLRLWEELNPNDCLNRRCPFTGEQISLERLFSSEIEIEHILPRSRTLDDSPANKTLSMRYANRAKGNQSPYESFAQSPTINGHKYSWEEIKKRAASLPNNKSWRFAPDAMDRFENVERDFLARQLVDTQYISHLAHIYLVKTGADVWVTPGRLTSDLRWTWGLDSILSGHNTEENIAAKKNRNDHRHHAIDAIVVGLTDRYLLQDVASAAGQAEVQFNKNYLAKFPEPWSNFRETVRSSIDRIVVSHKPDHGVQGALHNDTAYGIISPPDSKGRSQVVHRVPLSSLSKPASLEAIRDPLIRQHLLSVTENLTGKDFTQALVSEGEKMFPPVRKVRIEETLSIIPIRNKKGEAYKAYKGDGNYCYDIYLDAKGKWTGRVVSRFEANQKGFNRKAKATKDGIPLIMRLRGNDILAIGEADHRQFMRVVMISAGRIILAGHTESGSLRARDADKEDPFKYLVKSPAALQKLKARFVHVNPAGQVFDPGPSP